MKKSAGKNKKPIMMDDVTETLAKKDKKTKKKRRSGWSIAWSIIKTTFFVGLFTFVICAFAFGTYLLSLDDEVDIGYEATNLNYSTTIYYTDANGEEQELKTLYATQNRSWVDLDKMPKHLKNAIIAIEDERFESHNGVDWKRTLGAAANMFLSMRSDFGGSTITQQLIKNLTGDKQDTVRRKLQEIMRALYIEKHYSKDTIIELYLNTIYLSQGCYGVATASEIYFGKDVSELTLAECASLVGITNLPTYYDPYINPDNNIKRQRNTLKKMYDLGFITKKEYKEALDQELVFKKAEKEEEEEESEVQSYFVDQVIRDVITDLSEELDISRQLAERMIYSGGLKIYTTVDMEIQEKMEKVFLDQSATFSNTYVRGRDGKTVTRTEQVFPKAAGKGMPECAMVIMDPYTGEVKGMVGGRGQKTQNLTWNRAVQPQQPGSTIKPIAIYAPAIEYGLINPQSPADDVPVSVTKSGKAFPKNEEENKYDGRMNATKALMKSVNTVPVRILGDLTIDRSFNFLSSNLGFSTLDKTNDKNISPLALGGLTNGATPLEMAAAYSAFANEGNYIMPRTYTKVLDNEGNVLLDNSPVTIDAMSEKTAEYMNYMLSKVMSPGGTGESAVLSNGMPAAGKTGTTDNNYDRWFVGYTPYYSAAVWYGYDNDRYIDESYSTALKVWHTVMNDIHKELPQKQFFHSGDNFQTVKVCALSGLLPSKHCSHDPRGSQVIEGYFHKDDVPTKRCDVHMAVNIDKVTRQRTTKHCPKENIISYTCLNISRSFPISGVLVQDEYLTIYKEPLKNGEFRFSRNNSNLVKLGATCVVHTTAQPVVESPPQKEPEEEDEPSDETPKNEDPQDDKEPDKIPSIEDLPDKKKPDDLPSSDDVTEEDDEAEGIPPLP